MKLHNNQLKLIQHLCRYSLLSYEDCLALLDTAGTKYKVALSYAFRPLTKNGYVSKRADGSVSILKKGRSLFPEEAILVSAGGGMTERTRVMTVSRVAMWLEDIQVPSYGERHDELQSPYFIPSACWRKIAPGILSTTRFAGILMSGKERLAVYDIGDGKMEWQVRAEGSLFYVRYGSFETKATGMVLICNPDRRNAVAKNIIQQTMWNRRHLLTNSYAERNKPVSWSQSPIKLKANYEHVYLTTPATLEEDLQMIFQSESIVRWQQGEAGKTQSPAQGDYEVWPNRVFVNPATDLLKFVYFLSAQKSLQQLLASEDYEKTPLRHSFYCRKKDIPILKMFPAAMDAKGTKVYVYQHQQDA